MNSADTNHSAIREPAHVLEFRGQPVRRAEQETLAADPVVRFDTYLPDEVSSPGVTLTRPSGLTGPNVQDVTEHVSSRVALLHVESGWVPPGTRVDEMESAIRTVCEPIFDRPLEDISFGQILVRGFFDDARASEPDHAFGLSQDDVAQRREAGHYTSSGGIGQE